jgi:16S rRNA (guanine527-N7)-methyltransferase
MADRALTEAHRNAAEPPVEPPPDVVELATRFDLDAFAATALGQLQSLLAHDPHAPTAVRDSQAILADHLADSLVALETAPLESAQRVADVGSGAGLPGLPLAIARPQTRFTLVEAAARKCAFIEEAIRACRLNNVTVVNSRVESWAPQPSAFDVVTCRAVAALEVVVEYAAPVLALGGSLIVWRGKRDLQAETRAAEAAELLGLKPVDVRQVWPYPAARDRHLHLFSKVRQTPPGFPRRPGVAVKRPLGAG